MVFFKHSDRAKIGFAERKWVAMINKRNFTMRAAVLLVALAAPLSFSSAKSHAQGTTNGQQTFVDNFIDPLTSSKQWDQTTNGGTLLFAKGSVFMKGVGGGFPVIKTRQNPFPVSGDWTASFGYRYTSIGHFGTELICQGPNGEAIADVHQDILGQLLQVKDNVSWKKADTEWHMVSFVGTDNHLSVYLDGELMGERSVSVRPTRISLGGILLPYSGDWDDLQVAFVSVTVGKHVLDKSVLHLDQPPAEATTQTVSFLSHAAAAVNVRDDDKTLFCVVGDSIHLAGNTSGQHRLSRRSFLIDGQPFTDLPANPNEDGYNFNWKPMASGSYHLDVKFTLENPFGTVVAKSVDVTVLPKAPLALQQFSGPVPASCPVSAHSVDTSVFHPTRVEFFLNDQSVGTANQAPFQATLPISKQSPGSYTVSYQAYDAQGARWNGEAETVTVPLRVKLTTPASVDLASEKDQTHFTADIVPGLKIVRVDYSVDDQRVASTTTPPYDAPVNLSAFKSGSHLVKAEVLIEDGETFINPPTTLTLTNQPDDVRQAQLAKDEADKKARLQKEEQDRQAKIDKQVADQISVRLAAERDAKLKEESYRQEIADNTVRAVSNNQVSVVLNGELLKAAASVGDTYLFSLRITNHSSKTIGPIEPDMRFDDFSFTEPLAYDESLSNPFDNNGFPLKYLTDRYHDLVVPANSSKVISYFAYDTLSEDKSKKPTRVSFMGTLRGFSITLKP